MVLVFWVLCLRWCFLACVVCCFCFLFGLDFWVEFSRFGVWGVLIWMFGSFVLVVIVVWCLLC